MEMECVVEALSSTESIPADGAVPSAEECLANVPDVQQVAELRREFDAQRAKLKELFLQKEEELTGMKSENASLEKQVEKVTSELNELKSQLLVAGLQHETNVETEKRKAAEEIASLQQLMREANEESNVLKNDMRKLQSQIQNLEGQNHNLKQHSPHHIAQESSLLAPTLALSAVSKKFSKKFCTDLFTSQDEEPKEDQEMLKTLVGTLEEEARALKDKLRSTDDELQRCRLGGDVALAATPASAGASGKEAASCDMCSNYEDQLVDEQKRVTMLEAKVLTVEKSAERHREDLLKEIGFRKDMEEKWNEKKEEHKVLVGKLSERLECAEQQLREAEAECKHAVETVHGRLAQFTADRERVQRELECLQAENDNLVGKYAVHSQVLQNERIDLPNTVEELQVAILKVQEELIIAKIGKEAIEEEKDKLSLQCANDLQTAEGLQTSLKAEIEHFNKQNRLLDAQCKSFADDLGKCERREKDALASLHDASKRCAAAVDAKKLLEDCNQELYARVATLQNELNKAEKVQKELVGFSQELQMQLENIRTADTQVRWQYEEDVDVCPACHLAFDASRRREHCRHCGQIFCDTCLRRVVPSGPNKRPARVCDVCHTLLDKSSRPYVSNELPHSPG